MKKDQTAHERALVGWKAIAQMFGVTERTMQARRQELIEVGVIFYMNHGRPPRKRVCAFPSLLMRWVILKQRDVGRQAI